MTSKIMAAKKIRSSKFFDLILIFLFLALFFTLDLMSQSTSKVLIHGHRGARAIHPENTLKAFSYALEIGVDVIELDLAVTKDNILVVSHDPFINKELCLDEKGNKLTTEIPIHSLTLEQVKTYDCGSLKNPRFPKQQPSPNERIPTLTEVFELVQNSSKTNASTVEFNIETKIYPFFPKASPAPDEFAKLLNDEILKYKLTPRVIVQSFDYRTLLAIKKLNSEVRTSQLISDNHLDLLAVAKSSMANIISPDWQWITKEQVIRLHKNNIQVAPWTANDPHSWQYLIDIGVDAIITDDPKALQDYMQNGTNISQGLIFDSNVKSNLPNAIKYRKNNEN